MLHSEVLSVVKSTRPKKRLEISKTPIYIVTTSNPKTCSIEIRRRTQASASMNMSYAPTESCTASQASTQAAESEPAEAEDKFDLSSLVAALPDSTFALPHVIMSVALETDQKLDMHTFEQWMKDFPALARYAKIQGVYQSYSTLVLLSVPVAVWNMLPENSACNFVGYTKSDNLFTPALDFKKVKGDNHSLVEVEPRKHQPADLSFEQAILGVAPEHWALVVQHKTGELKSFTSSSLATYCDEILMTKFTKKFLKYTARADGPKPQQTEYNSAKNPAQAYAHNLDHDWDSDESGEFIAAQKRRRRQPHWNSDSEESEEELLTPLPNPKQKPTTLRIGNNKELEKFYQARLTDLQTLPCKILAKAFVKVVEPRKSSRYPYSKGQISAPPWWPALSGTVSVRHKDPDHLFKPERIRLLVHILRMAVELVTSQHPSFQDQDVNVQKLEDVAYEALSPWFKDPENPENMFRAPLIRELFKVAKHEEWFKNGEIDADIKISVMYLGSLEEESGEDEDVAGTEASTLPASGEQEAMKSA
ncbi:hypothetical protein DL95DRAFT_469495 [Leptodontidium sp. 2 PMI_412]|nr:hypothetical protein DL95DRAFT_469495 [Leptodontidium sp. 2 PMI_412]